MRALNVERNVNNDLISDQMVFVQRTIKETGVNGREIFETMYVMHIYCFRALSMCL